jgi:hypothetical protein
MAAAVTGNGVVPASRRSRFLIIGRDLCTFAWIDQRAVEERRARRREAELEAMRVAQANDAGLYMVLFAHGAAIWSWDNTIIDEAIEQSEEDNLGELIRVPEILMQAPQVGSDGFRIVSCLRGFEGQYWTGGAPVSARWWARAPSDADWLVFATAVGASQDMRAPGPAVAHPLPAPFAANDHKPQRTEVINPRLAFWGGAAGAAAAVAFLAYAGGVEVRHAMLASDVRTLEKAAAPVRALHAQVRADAAEYDRLTKALRGVNASDIVTEVAAILVTAHVRANSIEYQNEKVIINIPKSFAPSTDIVLKLMEDSPLLSNARLGEAIGENIPLQANVETPS